MPNCLSKTKKTPILANFHKTVGRFSVPKSRPIATSTELDYDHPEIGKDLLMPKLNVGVISMNKVRSRENKGDRVSIAQLNAKSSCENFSDALDNSKVCNQLIKNLRRRSVTYCKMR